MARRADDDGTRQSAQVIFMIEPETAGRVEAWRVKRGVRIKSAQFREIFLAGLAALEPGWAVEHGNLSRARVKRAVELAPRGAKTEAGETPKQLAAARAAEMHRKLALPEKPVKVAKPRKRAVKAATAVA